MRGCIRVSRFLVAAFLAFLIWTDLPATSTQAGPPVVGPAAERSAEISSRGGPRLTSSPGQGRDILTALPQLVTPPPSPTPRPTDPPTPKPKPRLESLGVFRVTGYSDSPRNGTDGRGITKSGEPTRWGVVAVDPRIIPLGTDLVIEGMEDTVFTALDTGGGVLGRWVDVWFPTDWEAMQHGMRQLNIYTVAR